MTWMIDGTINLTEVCERAEWHLGTAIDGLVAKGMTRQDAEAFADLAFTDHAVESGGSADHRAEDAVTCAQWDRLSLVLGTAALVFGRVAYDTTQ